LLTGLAVQVRVMVHERDEYIFNKLRQLRGTVVGVVGMVSAPSRFTPRTQGNIWQSGAYKVCLSVKASKGGRSGVKALNLKWTKERERLKGSC
jgi:hypothetical protein